MATYVIGDLQGCFDELQNLLKHIDYQPDSDILWFVGDLVNRGPKSLECLRFVKKLQEKGRAFTVLGNHDFHLLSAYAGLQKFLSKSDTLDEILKAKDVRELMDWLREQPLMVTHAVYNAVLVHAGIPPQWTISQAQSYAKEVELHLQGDDWQRFLTDSLFDSHSNEWQETLTGRNRIRYIVNAFTRMRYCDANGKLEFKLKSAPSAEKPEKRAAHMAEFEPWFVLPNRKNKDYEIFFGHWSTLGAIDAYHVHATDTGCLWGGSLTAYSIEEKRRYTVDCRQQCKPKAGKRTKK
ncbi:MAG: symmetrical bis(5'-nucleosyl)-tetraphosphatase [Pseudomonadota bacterium]